LVVSVAARESAEGPLRVLELAGEADMTCRHLKDALDAEVAAGTPLLVVDLSGLSFMDSWTLRTILAAGRELRGAGGTMALANPSRIARRVLELTEADTLVPVHDSVVEASRRRPGARAQAPPGGCP
jgi:anti-anti-sigma factor